MKCPYCCEEEWFSNENEKVKCVDGVEKHLNQKEKSLNVLIMMN